MVGPAVWRFTFKAFTVDPCIQSGPEDLAVPGGGASVLRLSFGRRWVGILPVAQYLDS